MWCRGLRVWWIVIRLGCGGLVGWRVWSWRVVGVVWSICLRWWMAGWWGVWLVFLLVVGVRVRWRCGRLVCSVVVWCVLRVLLARVVVSGGCRGRCW